MTEFYEITYAEWVDKFKPLCDEYGLPILFETYGEDREFLLKQNPLTVWTYCNDGEWEYISNTVGSTNRIGYYVTEIPYKEGDSYQADICQVEQDEEDSEEDE